MFAPIIYSPRPPQDYIIKSMPVCEVSEILKLDAWASVWNLFWLSTPTIDSLPGAGLDWWKAYQPVDGLLKAIVEDVLNEEPLLRKVQARPAKFLEFWHRTDISVYETHGILGDDWANTVLTRAHEARDRLAGRVTGREGNVVSARFGKAA